MKVTLICNEYPPQPHGGIGTFVQTVARALDARGHEVTVVGLGKPGAIAKDMGVTVVRLPSNTTPIVGNIVSRLSLWLWLSRRARARIIDVIEVPDYLGLLPITVRGATTVVRLHLSATAMFSQARRKIPKGIAFYERRTLVANRNWIGVSNTILQMTETLFNTEPARSAVIYNSVAPSPRDLPDALDLPQRFILYAGQVSKRKGALVLAQACQQIMAIKPDLHVVFVGG